MKKLRSLAAGGAAVIIALQSIVAFADYTGYDYGYDNTNEYGYGYDYNYGYDNTYDYSNDYTADQTTDTWNYGNDDTTWTDTTTTGDADSSTDSSSSPDPNINKPASVILEPTPITDKKFSATLKINTNKPITAIDLTVNYDSKVLKLNKAEFNRAAGGKGVAGETSDGVLQFQYQNAAGAVVPEEDDSSSLPDIAYSFDNQPETDTDPSDDSSAADEKWDGGYLTLDFEIIAPTERSTVLYMTLNSLTDENHSEITYSANGTIIQIEGAIPVDISADESMYTELRVALSDQIIPFESLGLTEVKNVTFDNNTIAIPDEGGIRTLTAGITNMTAEFNDGTLRYYRIVISEPTVVTTQLEDGTIIEIQPGATTAATTAPITRVQTHSSKRTKYLIIYILVLVAIIAIFVEFFVFYGNPYKKTADILRNSSSPKPPKQKKPTAFEDDDDMFPDTETAEDGEYYDGDEYEDTDDSEHDEEYVDEYADADTDEDGAGYEEYEEYEDTAEDTEYDGEYEYAEDAEYAGEEYADGYAELTEENENETT